MATCQWKDCEKKSLKSSEYCKSHKGLKERQEETRRKMKEEKEERKKALDAVIEPRELNYKSLQNMANPEGLPKLFIPKEKKEGEDVITAVDKICRKALEAYIVMLGCAPGAFATIHLYPSHCRGFSFEEISEEFKKRGYECFPGKYITVRMTSEALLSYFER